MGQCTFDLYEDETGTVIAPSLMLSILLTGNYFSVAHTIRPMAVFQHLGGS